MRCARCVSPGPPFAAPPAAPRSPAQTPRACHLQQAAAGGCGRVSSGACCGSKAVYDWVDMERRQQLRHAGRAANQAGAGALTEPGCCGSADEELGAVCAGARIGHRQRARLCVLQLKVLVSKGLACRGPGRCSRGKQRAAQGSKSAALRRPCPSSAKVQAAVLLQQPAALSA